MQLITLVGKGQKENEKIILNYITRCFLRSYTLTELFKVNGILHSVKDNDFPLENREQANMETMQIIHKTQMSGKILRSILLKIFFKDYTKHK